MDHKLEQNQVHNQVHTQEHRLEVLLQQVDKLLCPLVASFLHILAFLIRRLPFQVWYIQHLCKQYNLGINLLNVLVFHFQSILDIGPMVLLHNKDHHIICNLLKLLFLLLHILDKVYNVQEENLFLYSYI